MTREGRLGPRWAGPTLTAVSGWMLMTALASACDRPRDIEVRVDTLASGRLLVSNPDLAAVREGKTLELVEELRIGAALSDAADAPELFGRVLFLSVDEDENTYVADYRSNEIRVFGREGNFVRTIGRNGEGPGEFGRLAGIVWDRANRVLWTVDIRALRFSAFDARGRVLATHPHGRDTHAAGILRSRRLEPVHPETCGKDAEPASQPSPRLLGAQGVEDLLLSPTTTDVERRETNRGEDNQER